ncbi:hypothetical protein TRFO_08552 [Tritrichomonas foetus]|uniref:Rab-GAP TBC domain-containing protein n=1 Tax=Tritrichomonas foetus TaxID=1144522 RepID=A0A1J4JN92_9EUKA|nr:hypothetical protein TRFO_08552 [Tritrichomonas foetus]|eukprot:OHS99011.1 hypothetical protein TRFO_08552 [Tritrichomonas foetus]
MSCKQEKHFQSVFPNGTVFKPALDDLVYTEKIDSFKIKSAIWKFYLEVFPNVDTISLTQQEWIAIIQQKREEYSKIKQKYQIHPGEAKDIDPLSADENSEWGQYFKDDKLMKLIQQDTNRLFQELDFFTNSQNISRINEIIFLHLRHFSHLKYCQGFHELCGVIFYLFSMEMKSKIPSNSLSSDTSNNNPNSKTKNTSKTTTKNSSNEFQDKNKDTSNINDPSYAYNFMFSNDDVDADVFWTYSALVDNMLDLYHVEDDPNQVPFCIKKAEEILNVLVRRENSELSDKINIPILTTPMISWLRVIYARQFPLSEILILWTKIFSFFPNNSILSFIGMALILSNKEKILSLEKEEEVISFFFKIEMSEQKEIIKEALIKMTEKSPDEKQTKIKSFLNPICCEVEKVIGKVCNTPVNDLINVLQKFKDSIEMITKSEDDAVLNGTLDLSGLQSLPACENSVIDVNIDIPIEMSPLSFMPKASQNGMDKIDFDLLTEENEENRAKPNDLFSNHRKGELF